MAYYGIEAILVIISTERATSLGLALQQVCGGWFYCPNEALFLGYKTVANVENPRAHKQDDLTGLVSQRVILKYIPGPAGLLLPSLDSSYGNTCALFLKLFGAE